MYAENFLVKILSNIKSLDSFSVVNDEHGSPTNANDLAELILKILSYLTLLLFLKVRLSVN